VAEMKTKGKTKNLFKGLEAYKSKRKLVLPGEAIRGKTTIRFSLIAERTPI